MEWLQVFTIAGSTIGACWVMHRENQKTTQDFRSDIAKEMKDFHGRLCILEERYLQMMQRYLENKK